MKELGRRGGKVGPPIGAPLLDGLRGAHLDAMGPINVGPFEQQGRSGLPPIFYKGEAYRPDSTLLIIEGCHEQSCDCARWYYTLIGERFKLILQRAVPKPAICINRR
jgi:hypothetical protein